MHACSARKLVCGAAFAKRALTHRPLCLPPSSPALPPAHHHLHHHVLRSSAAFGQAGKMKQKDARVRKERKAWEGQRRKLNKSPLKVAQETANRGRFRG